MVKKVFKIIGIVLAGVLGLSGAVIGVLALMGEFKTPNVPPDALFFENEEMVIVDTYNSDDFYSFTLLGTNSEETEHEVNQTVCYLEFVDNVGANLIELYDSNKNKIEKEFSRYKTHCNDLTYFKLVPNKDVLNVDGKVVLRAKSEGDTAITANNLTIWIDRQIKVIGVKDGEKVPKNSTQDITIGTDIEKEIQFVADPSNSLTPISKPNSDKVVELYLDDRFNAEDYIKVTPESVKTGNLSKIVKYDEETGKFYFLSASEADYNFKIAVFRTLEERLAYEADESNLTKTNDERLQSMLVTNLKVHVVDADITTIDMESNSGIKLDLFNEYNYVTLSGGLTAEELGVADDVVITSNNLGLKMYKDGLDTDIRFDSTKYGELSNNVKETDPSDVMLESEDDETKVRLSDLINPSYELSSIKVDGYTLIQQVKDGVGNTFKTYKILEGVGVVGGDGQFYGMLTPGVYLDFYKYENDCYSLQKSEYDSASKIYTTKLGEENVFKVSYVLNTTEAKKSWKIVPMREIEQNENICLGVLVINRNGEYNDGDLFKAVTTVVEEKPLDYTKNINQNGEDIILSFKEGDDNAEILSDPIDFNELITKVTGSYNTLVFASTSPVFENVGSVQIDDGGTERTYYILGYYDTDNTDKKFKNVIKFKTDEQIKAGEIKLSLLQLKKSYGQSIEEVLKGTKEVKNKVDNILTINPKIELDENGFAQQESADVYNNEEGKELILSEQTNYKGMLGKFQKFYEGKGTNHLTCYYKDAISTNITISGIAYDNGELKITYNTGELYDSEETFKIKYDNLILGEIKVLNSAPVAISYKDGNFVANTYISEDVAKVDTTDYIKLTIGYEDYNYTCKAEIYNANETSDTADDSCKPISNLNLTTKKDDAGFQDANGFKVEHGITYTSLNTEFFTVAADGTMNFVHPGEGALAVKFGGETRYIKVVVEQSGFNFAVKDQSGNPVPESNDQYKVTHTIGTNTFNLSEYVNLYHSSNSTNTLINREDVLIKNVNVVTYGNGNLNYSYTDKSHTLKEENSTDDTLKIEYVKGAGWKFTRSGNINCPLTIGFDVYSPAGTIKIELTIETDVKVMFNEDFWHTKTIFAGTTIQLLEIVKETDATFTTDALIRVRGLKPDINTTKYSIGGSEGSITITQSGSYNYGLATYAFTKTGIYTLSIKNNGTTIATIRDIKVVPNAVVLEDFFTYDASSGEFTYSGSTPTTISTSDPTATIDGETVALTWEGSALTRIKYRNVVFSYNQEEEKYTRFSILLESAEEYDINSVFTNVKSFATGDSNVYGLSSLSYYNALGNLKPTVTVDYTTFKVVALDEDKNIKDDLNNNLITCPETPNGKFSIGWLKDINAIKVVTLTLTAGEQPIIYGEIAVEIKNKYSVTQKVNDPDNNLMALKSYKISDLLTIPVDATIVDVQLLEKTIKWQEFGVIEYNSNLYRFNPTTRQYANESGNDFFALEAGKLMYYSDLEADGVEFRVSDTSAINSVDNTVAILSEFDYYITLPIVMLDIDDADIIFTFTLNNKELTYSTKQDAGVTLNVKRWEPAEKDPSDAYTGADYNFFMNLFEGNDYATVDTINLEKVEIDDVDKTNEVLEDFSTTNGYKSGSTLSTSYEIKDFLTDNDATVTLVYKITKNNITWYIERPLTIKNRQQLTITYPENEFGRFANNEEITFISANSNQSINHKVTSSEAILISPNSSTDLLLSYDDVKKVERVKITDKDNKNLGLDYIKNVNVYYYDQTGGQNALRAYAEKVQFSAGVVTLPSAEKGTKGYILLEIVTTSNNTDYYCIYVYSDDEAMSHIEINKTISEVEDLESNNTLAALIGVNSSDGLKIFGKEYIPNNFEFYILSAMALDSGLSADEYVVDNFARYSKLELSSTKKIEFKSESTYITMVISVMYNQGVNKYCLGTVTLYLAPETPEEPISAIPTGLVGENSTVEFTISELTATHATYGTATLVKQSGALTKISYKATDYLRDAETNFYRAEGRTDYFEYDSTNSKLNYYNLGIAKVVKNGMQISNGEYIATIDANTTTLDCPFKVGTNDFTDVSFVGTQPVGINKSGAQLTLTRVATDTTFTVLYNYGSLYVQVTYTYLATSVPSNKTFTDIGKFDASLETFNNVFEIGEDILGSYTGDYEVYIKKDDGSYGTANTSENGVTATIDSVSGKVTHLTFTQTSTAQTKFIKVEYTQFGGIEREFTFSVLAGYAVVNNNQADIETVIEDSGTLYTTAVGSTLTFTKTTIGSSITKYTITKRDGTAYYNGFAIYTTADSKLKISLGSTYMLNNVSETIESTTYDVGKLMKESITLTSGSTLNFVHIPAENVRTEMYIDVLTNQTEEQQYIKVQKNLQIVKTYEGIEAQYVTKGAAHENVKTGDNFNLYAKLFETEIAGVNDVTVAISYNSKTYIYSVGSEWKPSSGTDYFKLESGKLNYYTNVGATGVEFIVSGSQATNVGDSNDKADIDSLTIPITNKYRIKLIGTNNNVVNVTNDDYFTSMGFNDMPGNPNKINFKLATTSTDTNIDTTNKITFGGPSAQPIRVQIYNNAGASCSYAFNVLAEGEGISYTNCSGEYVKTTGTNTTEYIAFNNYYTNVDRVPTPSTLVIGDLNDSASSLEAFYLTGVPGYSAERHIIRNDNSQITSVVYAIYKDETSTGVAGELDTEDANLNGILDAGEDANNNGKLDLGELKLILTLTKFDNNRRLYCKYVGDNTNSAMESYKISLHGASGDIVKDLELVFIDVTVKSNYSSIYDTTVYGNDTVYNILGSEPAEGETSSYKITSNAVSNTTLILDEEKSTYTLEGKEYKANERQYIDPTTSQKAGNELFYFNNNTLTVRDVAAKEVETNLEFKVYYTTGTVEYYIGTVQYKLKIQGDYVIATNFGTLADSISENDLGETLFKLSNDKNFTKFNNNGEVIDESQQEYIIYRKDNANLGDEKPDGDGNYKYISFTLYDLSIFKKSVDNTESLLENSKVGIACVSIQRLGYNQTQNADEIKKYIKITNDGSEQSITFIKDFTGILSLELTVKSSNGTYTFKWDIKVTGVVTLKTEAVAPSTSTYNSGETVYPFKVSGDGSRFVEINYNGNSSVDVAVNACAAKYIREDEYLTSEEVWKDNNATDINGYNAYSINQNGDVQLILPNVPTSMKGNETTWLVVFEIKLKYLEYTTEAYYMAYRVQNVLDIVVNSNPQIDLDSELTTGDVTQNTGTYLELFKYGTPDPETLFKSNFNNADKYLDFVNEIGYIKLTDSETGAAYYFKLEPLGSETITYIVEETSHPVVVYNDDKTNISTINGASAPDGKFKVGTDAYYIYENNILKYYENSQAAGVECSIVVNPDSVKPRGINLASAYKNANDFTDNNNKYSGTDFKLVTNEMSAKFEVVSKAGTTLVSVDAWSKQNTAGFKLFTNKALSAAAAKQYTIGDMFNNAYLTATLNNETDSTSISYSGDTYSDPNKDNKYEATGKTDYFQKDVNTIKYFFNSNSVGVPCSINGKTLKFDIPSEMSSINILGITNTSTASKNWVNNASDDDSYQVNLDSTNLFVTIYVPNDTATPTIYEIYNPIYQGSADTEVYTITEDFYVIKSDAGNVVVSNPSYETINFNPDAPSQSKTTGIIKVFTMGSDAVIENYVSKTEPGLAIETISSGKYLQKITLDSVDYALSGGKYVAAGKDDFFVLSAGKLCYYASASSTAEEKPVSSTDGIITYGSGTDAKTYTLTWENAAENIEVSNDNLKAYSEANPDADYLYVTYKITYTYNGIDTTVMLYVRFVIPDQFPETADN